MSVARRDRLIAGISNWLVNHVATEGYKTHIEICYSLGRWHLERELLAGRAGTQEVSGVDDAP